MEKNNNFKDEINFRDIIKSPIKLFGWLFPLYFIIIMILGIYFAQHLNQISFNEQSAGLLDTINVKKEITPKKGTVQTAFNLSVIKNPTKEMISKGKELFEANCSSCHGQNGFGDGVGGTMLNPKPRNFHQKDEWVNGRTIDAMYKTLQEGITKSGMPAYDFIKPEDRFNIILYIRTFTDFPPVTEDQLDKLKSEYKLDQNIVTPSQIPVSKAINIIVEENKTLREKIEGAKQRIFMDNAGANILLENSENLDKVLNSFIMMNDKSFQNFISSIIKSPILFGFKPSVLRLDKNGLKMVYDYLINITK